MGNWLSDEPYGVTIEGDPNTVYIRPKMDYGTLARVQKRAEEATGAGASGKKIQDMNPQFYLNTWNIILLEVNIVSWEGPDFDGLPITREQIEKWDPDAPLLNAILAKISEFNFGTTADGGEEEGGGASPNSPTTVRGARTKAKPTKAALTSGM